MIAGVKIENGSLDPDHAPLMGGLLSMSLDIILSTYCGQKMITRPSAVPEISLEAPEFKMGNVTLTTPILRVICHPYAGT